MNFNTQKCEACPHAVPDGAEPSPCCARCRREPRGKLIATDWLADVDTGAEFGPVEVLFKNTRIGFYSNPLRIPLKIGDIVAVEASPGHDIGRVSMVGPLVAAQMKKNGVKSTTELKKVFRIARRVDIEKFEEARSREHETMIKSRKIAEELELDMKIGDVEYQGDGGKAIFYYIADERVDFRKLIRILADTFKVRIEMKQIGARQEAGRIGGIGPCGRPLCCASWMTHFVSVGTGSARLQDLSMNPQKLAGQCAKLKCCLNFEIDVYSESHKALPPKDVTLETKDATYYYFKPDILARKITYSTDKSIPANLVTIDASRAFEIIALNKQGVKVDSLEAPSEGPVTEKKEYVDLVGQDSLTRFDKSKRRKRGKKKGDPQPQAAKRQDKREEKREEGESREDRPKQKQKPRQQRPEQERKEGGQRKKQRPRPQRGGDAGKENHEQKD